VEIFSQVYFNACDKIDTTMSLMYVVLLTGCRMEAVAPDASVGATSGQPEQLLSMHRC
jgi:hypothetical protein